MTTANSEPQKRLHFKHPPIVEAVIAVSIEMAAPEAINSINEAAEALARTGYNQSEPVWQHEVEVRFEPGSSAVGGGSTFQLGFKYKSDDGLHAVQFNRSGMIFSRLGNYRNWEEFRAEAHKLWDIFTSALGQTRPTGLAVRYINKLHIPINEPIEHYVTVYPHIPENLPQRIDGMLMRLVMPLTKPQGRLFHTQVILPPEREGFVAVLLDNDFQFDLKVLPEADMWDFLETVRDVKDEYFQKFTTDKMRSTFDA